MVSAGIFPEFEGVELIYGEFLKRSPVSDELVLIDISHRDACVRRLNRTFNLRLGDSAVVDIRSPIALYEQRSEPQPEVALLRPREDAYAAGTPTSSDVFLVVEIENPAIADYLRLKLSLYAKTYIPETWRVHMNSETVWVHRQPSRGEYQDARPYRRGDSIAPEAFPETAFSVDEILG